jgi:hypothetical protein
VPVEMWKTHFTVVCKQLVFHTPCGKAVEKIGRLWKIMALNEVSHFSTRGFTEGLWKCGKLLVSSANKRLARNRPVENFSS